MLIREEQVAGFEAAVRGQWRSRLAARLAASGRTVGIAEIEAIEARAAAHGITASEPLAQYVALVAALGPAFEAQPAVAAYLADRSIDAETKMTALLDALDGLPR